MLKSFYKNNAKSNSKQGIQFRQWATQRLKDYLVKGYATNQKHPGKTEDLCLSEARAL
ncbi:MAG: virulence RhuM family protein [Bacteroidetes bacterium]|nr:virulence RhuM family protein [Bacteroidota bacterium]